MCEDALRVLDEEEDRDNRDREKHGNLWQRNPSHTLTAKLREDIAKYRGEKGNLFPFPFLNFIYIYILLPLPLFLVLSSSLPCPLFLSPFFLSSFLLLFSFSCIDDDYRMLFSGNLEHASKSDRLVKQKFVDNQSMLVVLSGPPQMLADLLPNAQSHSTQQNPYAQQLRGLMQKLNGKTDLINTFYLSFQSVGLK